MKGFQDLIVWQKAYDLSLKTYQITNTFPKTEIFGLTSQICRAAVSIPANIAEGFGRRSKKEYRQFLRIAYGSGAELITELMIANKLEYGLSANYKMLITLLDEIMRMLYVMDGRLAEII